MWTAQAPPLPLPTNTEPDSLRTCTMGPQEENNQGNPIPLLVPPFPRHMEIRKKKVLVSKLKAHSSVQVLNRIHLKADETQAGFCTKLSPLRAGRKAGACREDNGEKGIPPVCTHTRAHNDTTQQRGCGSNTRLSELPGLKGKAPPVPNKLTGSRLGWA